jgi:predicted aldo/keto reductase-like oxidoreductase
VRDKVIIGTKVYVPQQRVDDPTEAEKKIIELCDGSLTRLKMDYVDILYIHSISSPAELDNPGMTAGLNALKKQGKIRATGVSTHTSMASIIDKVAEQESYDVILTAINFTMADDGALLAAIDKAASKGIGIVAMKTMAGAARPANPETTRRYSRSVMALAAMKWVMRNENIHTSIPGYDNYEYMREDFQVASNIEYTDEEKAFLDDNDIKLGMGYCRQCKECLASCPVGADVPTLMRVHMYTKQYANFGHAKTTLGEIPAGKGLDGCSKCSVCSASCVRSVDIARNIDELKVVYA